MKRSCAWRARIVCLTGVLAVGFCAAISRAPEPLRRTMSDAEMESIVGGGGGAPPPAITFEDSKVALLASAGATVTYRFYSPASGPQVTLSLKAQDEGSVAVSGTYKIAVCTANANPCNTYTVTGPTPTLLQDVSLATGAAFDVKVTDMGGTVPRNVRLTMSPRYTLSPTPFPFASSQAMFLPAAGVQTFAITVGPSQYGRTDIFFDDTSISLSGADNVVTVIGPDRVTVKAKDVDTGDISLDCSDFPSLEFTEDGEHLVVVTNMNASASGNYVLHLGPYPGQIPPDDTLAPCETMSDPGFGTPVSSPVRAINRTGDRDCFFTNIPAGVTSVTVALDDIGGGTSGNEIRLLQGNNVVKSKTGGGDTTLTATLLNGGAYTVEINNTGAATPSYQFTVSVPPTCIGASCKLIPGTEVKLTSTSIGTWTEVLVWNTSVSRPLPPTANASFYIDRLASGNYDAEIRRDNGTVLCSKSGTADFLIENCNISTPDGLVRVAVRSANGGGVIIKMGPELATKAADPITDGQLTGEVSLIGFGDEDFYTLDISTATGGQIGIGFDDKGLGPDDAEVRVCTVANRAACMVDDGDGDPNNDPEVIVSFRASGDGGSDTAKSVPIGQYVAIVDNSGLGDGDYRLCLGPGDVADIDATSVPAIAIDHLLSTTEVSQQVSNLTCGDADKFTLTVTPQQRLKLKVKEDSGVPGSMRIDVLRAGCEDVPHCSTVGNCVVACDHGSGSATISDVNLGGAAETYTIRIDNSGFGAPNYTLKIGAFNTTQF